MAFKFFVVACFVFSIVFLPFRRTAICRVEGRLKVNRRVQSDQCLGALFACGKPVFVPTNIVYHFHTGSF